VAEFGPYDVIHSAVHHFSGYVLRLASQCNIPGRIAHSHNASPGSTSELLRPAYLRLMKHWVKRYATAGLACSTPAAEALFGRDWKSDSRWRLHYPSTDLSAFEAKVSRLQVRRELGIPCEAFVIGHVGRFDPQKNHSFLTEVVSELARHNPHVRVVLVGDGPLKNDVEAQVGRLGLQNYFVFTGLRADVPRLMIGAMDCFVLPSVHEGLPLAAVEAQAAGLPVLMSDAITPEAAIIPELVTALSLSDSVSAWSEAIQRISGRPRMNPCQALETVANSPFNSERALKEIEQLYTDQFRDVSIEESVAAEL
jgi:glycosyltransferase involved in cell wall biosynthesis